MFPKLSASPVAATSILCALLAAPPIAMATTSASCEPIRSRIEANIRSKGIADFRVIVADAAAQEPGRRVGDCEGGRKVILYQRGATTPAGSPVAAAPAKARPTAESTAPILTECLDGTVRMGGDCKRR